MNAAVAGWYEKMGLGSLFSAIYGILYRCDHIGVIGMTDAVTSLEELLAKTMASLQAAEQDLQELAQLALACANRVTDCPGLTEQSALRLQKVSRRLTDLSERSGALHFCLANDLDIPPLDGHHWPRIKVLQSQEEERMQVARTMEDSVGQLLANTVFELASYRQLLVKAEVDPAKAAAGNDGLEQLQAELEQGLANLRHLIIELDPTTILSNFGLGGGIRRYLEQYQLKTGLATELRINTNFGRLPAMIEIGIFRIIQEALDNVYRHANASQVEIVITEEDDQLQFSVIDNGQGLSSTGRGRSRKNLGLARMIDYAELLNGKLRVLSEPGRGTQVILAMPYPVL